MNRRQFCSGLTIALAGLSRGRRTVANPNKVMVAISNNTFATLLDGQPTGIMVEAIDYVLRAIGKEPGYIVMPTSEMAAAFKNGTVSVNSVAVETAGNQSQYRFSDPIITEYNVVAVNRTQTLKLDNIGDLKHLKLGGRTGYQYPLLDADPEIQLIRFPQDGELIRNLIHKRIDAAIISAVSDIYKLRAEGVMSRIKVLDRAVGAVPLRAALSPLTFDKTDVGRFNETLASLKASSKWTEILERNGLADLAVEWTLVPG